MYTQQIEDLLAQLTLEEKIKMIHGSGLFETAPIWRLQIPALHFSDGPMGVRNEFPANSWIPVGNSDDYVTYCPSNSAIAATWNRDLAYSSGQVLGEEARGRGKDVILGPGINIKRSPLCGRNFEYMSEDPYLISELVVPMINGIQESDVAACVKHFALNNQETERLWVNVEIRDRALREIYLPGFEAAVKKANSLSIMSAYNLFRGVHCSENQELLDDILRKEWGYKGLVVSDWSAVHNTYAAANCSLDVEMSVSYDFDEYYLANPLLEAVRKGEISEDLVDEKVRHILELCFKLKMIESENSKNEPRKSGCYNTYDHHQKVRRTAEESVILLKNENNRLPLNKEKIKKLLVIGDNAERLHANGGGSAEIKALYEISPLLGLKSNLGGNVEVAFSRGYYVSPKEESEVSWQETSTEDQIIENPRDRVTDKVLKEREILRKEAIRLATEYEDVVLFVGLNHDYDVEGYDRDDISLPYDQDMLISEVLEVNPNAIIVVMAGSPIAMNKWNDKAKAILFAYYSGMEFGNVITDILFGNINPSGKLPETFPYSADDCSAHKIGEFGGRPLTEDEEKRMNAHVTEEYLDGIYVGYRYYEKYQVPASYDFGYGLSYTSFEYSKLHIESYLGGDISLKETSEDEVLVKIGCNVKNVGLREGKEILQLYIGKKDSKVDRPIKELKGFEKVNLCPGEEKQVDFSLNYRSFAYYDEDLSKFVVEKGNYQIYIGASLSDIRLMGDLEI